MRLLVASKWSVTLRSGKNGDLVFDLKSEHDGFLKAQPGKVIAGGGWTGLDLNQYQLAHGQTNWPKTYYLRKHNLFLCAWWDWHVSNASTPVWPNKECEPRKGDGKFSPAASMLYRASPGWRSFASERRSSCESCSEALGCSFAFTV